MSVEEILINGEEKMEKAVNNLKREYGNVRTGRANPLILEKISVEYYGVPTPLRQVANVSVQDGQTLVISPFDKTLVHEIEKSIAKSDIGITPNSDGTCVRMTFPPLTEDRRKEISKQVRKTAEESKVAIRNIRRDMTDELKKVEKADNLSEDEVKDTQNEIQKLTDKFTKIIDNLSDEKEKEVLKV
ncbi:MAG: ribosome recycling factor [Candidatus Gastranaerophilales bacterium]|nr:ribosome recycling factor [Candidatus Gastranaerophilales bacterium]